MLDAILMIVSALMIILSLLQSGKTDGMSGAFTGNGGLNLLSLPVESAAIAGEIVEFLEDYLETEEGNW